MSRIIGPGSVTRLRRPCSRSALMIIRAARPARPRAGSPEQRPEVVAGPGLPAEATGQSGRPAPGPGRPSPLAVRPPLLFQAQSKLEQAPCHPARSTRPGSGPARRSEAGLAKLDLLYP